MIELDEDAHNLRDQGEDVQTIPYGSLQAQEVLQESHSHLYTMVQEEVTYLFKTLAQIDARLFCIDQLLFRLQPTAPGKLRIRWYLQRGGSKYRIPVFVQLRRKTSKGWIMKIVKSPRHAIHRSGEFGNFSGEVTSLIYHAQKLIERRAKVIASITSLVRYHAQPAWKKSNDETISFFDEALQNILDEIRKKNYHIDKEETNVDMYTAAMMKNFSVGVQEKK